MASQLEGKKDVRGGGRKKNQDVVIKEKKDQVWIKEISLSV